MKAMIWKEWRENAKWAGLAFVTMSLAMAYMCYRNWDAANSQTLFTPLDAIEPVLMFMVPLFATVLGILQVATELRRDQWAFLMHRPVSRGVIFIGKAIGGLSLYVLATLLPVLLLILWSLIPGKVPTPFDWRQLLGPIASILGSIPFYFAGMLVAVRPARWYGSRALGFSAAIACSMFVNTVPELWQALLAILIFGPILVLAAWGSFITSGDYDPQPKIAKIALGFCLYLGILEVVGLSTAMVVAIKGDYDRREVRSQDNRIGRTQYGITPAGRIVRYTITELGFPGEGFDLQGRTVSLANKNGIPMLQPATLLYKGSAPSIGGYVTYRSSQRYWSIINNAYRSIDPAIYYWVNGKRHIAVFSKEGNVQIGTIGSNGFVPSVSGVAKSFPEPRASIGENYLDRGKQLLVFPHSVCIFHTQTRTVTSVFSTSSSEGIQGVISWGGFQGVGTAVVAIVADQKIYFCNGNGKLLFSMPLGERKLENVDLSVCSSLPNQHIFLWYTPVTDFQTDFNRTRESSVTEFTRTGKLVGKYSLPPLNQPAPPFFEGRLWYENVALRLEAPPAAMAYITVWINRLYQKEPVQNRDVMVNLVLNDLIWTLIVSAALMPVTFQVARRAALSAKSTWGWTAATLLLGLSALLLLLAIHEWPALVKCPNCGKKRSVEKEHCEHCGAIFPQPERDATAIFEEGRTDADVEQLVVRV
ncbi:hypothetical protein EON80_08150 [bacterium]|nr:MAG: hypothetical protein EON80_08150 [bacterium]